MGFNEDKKRVSIPSRVKTEVYKRAQGRCECLECLIKDYKMASKMGVYHHLRTPRIPPTAKTVLFLCPNCHQWYAHKRKTKTERGWYEDTKISIVQRINVAKHDYSDSKKVVENLTVTQLKEIAKKFSVKVKGKIEQGFYKDTVKAPTKAQFVSALSKELSPQQLSEAIKKLPKSARKK